MTTERDVLSALSLALERDGEAVKASIVDVRQPWHNVSDVAFSQLSASLLKKWQGGSRPTKQACDAAKTLFLHSNSSCAEWQLDWSLSWEESLIGEIRQALYNFWFSRSGNPICSNWAEVFEKSRTGPGSSVGSLGQDFYTKLFASPLAAPSRMVGRMYHHDNNADHLWNGAESIRASNHGLGVALRGSRLSFAPKNATVARCICVEPSLGIYSQLGFGAILERSLLRNYGINLANQPFKNRELARLGSLDDSFATIDLSCASDSISLKMLAFVLPREWLYWLLELRSKDVQIGDDIVELNMVSSMGNGFTFPLQTILFSAVVLASFRICGMAPDYPRGSSLGNFGVFGDDIIVPKSITPVVLRGLAILGFSVNASKTFVEGPFRESCGHDYYRGLNVRGVYVKTLRTVQDRASLINQLNLFSLRTGFLVRHLVREVWGRETFHLVPRWENDDSGVKVPAIYSRNFPISKRYQSRLYRCWRPFGRSLHVWDSWIHSPPGHRLRTWNPDGLLLSFLKGAVNTMKIGLREEAVRYRTKSGVAPDWDAAPATHPLDSGFVDWQRWETVVRLNIPI